MRWALEAMLTQPSHKSFAARSRVRAFAWSGRLQWFRRNAGAGVLVFGVLAGALGAEAAVARTLFWDSLAVEARLDRDGILHVRERHAMVFSGNWNGGERRFNIRSGQRLDFRGMSRLAGNRSAEIPLTQGSLDRVDHWDFHDSETIRWRSRLPSDPVFDSTPIVYVLDYSLTGVLQADDGLYRLDHDFAFPDRVGPIEHFQLDLEIAPVWESSLGSRRTLARGPLPPGASVFLTSDLSFGGEGVPSGVLRYASDLERLLPFALALLLVVSAWLEFHRHEKKQGRYDSVDGPAELDRGWLEERVFSLRPEVVGALWDGIVSRPEVSALIARWVVEGKVGSSVRERERFWSRSVLELKLRARRNEFSGYQRRLLDKLFFSGDQTDTEAVRKHYRGKGFSPSATIAAGIERRIRALPGMGRKIAGPDKTPGCLLMMILLALMVLAFWRNGDAALILGLALVVGGILPMLMASSLAFRYRRRPAVRPISTIWFLAPVALLGAWLVAVVLAPGRFDLLAGLRLGWFGHLAAALLFFLVARSTLNWARTRDSRARVIRRKELDFARRLFARELDRPDPRLEDDWLPYLLAFGLGGEVDQWSRSYGPETSRSSWTGTSGSGSSGRGWTGGGGAFGGAGATAAWTAAAAGMAAGVARPSSGSSGGGSSGGGGGGSSGGGGGGGW